MNKHTNATREGFLASQATCLMANIVKPATLLPSTSPQKSKMPWRFSRIAQLEPNEMMNSSQHRTSMGKIQQLHTWTEKMQQLLLQKQNCSPNIDLATAIQPPQDTTMTATFPLCFFINSTTASARVVATSH
ncbi:hypothetical protein ACH5RR_017781 [Cinchona calisaya]|uniref:Uncharacterized protein n=1 Tax=Cinchona calisaya TaxID=153742 RepID=A0ABD2ZNB5_9GENT